MERKMTKLAEKKISVDPIPLDLIPEILIGLPVKTLTRLLCVSKQYASIIRNRDFIKSYLIMSCTRPQSLITPGQEPATLPLIASSPKSR
ncbi:F-box protein [Cardamine amara subsp. amara]|uniref:F-box protein n=1 Tax=Cardamine amara subsp. amara TaxID=228776 RepID=A0ABD1AYC9_CARAN